MDLVVEKQRLHTVCGVFCLYSLFLENTEMLLRQVMSTKSHQVSFEHKVRDFSIVMDRWS